MNEERSLYIPQGLKTENEIFDGFGRKEMVRASLICLIAIFIDALIYLLTSNTLICVIFMLSSITASIMATQKDKSNISIYDQIKFMIRFSKTQKYYPYKHLPEWGEEVEK
ncbi:hypothetical protein [Proteiniborus sp. MB09-C3]|uniref:hypothetical protein n=1 Tax=Proteiniborus sp. MB09-C3 TaxID=3050072 RepID=UPI00255478EC|nr:hypothetical protein [Proteiniborus sp. MB09-C3]WIV11158.1 hypothetical protein QO263_13495 [Proteiniborus sp. MB09-C3]